MCSGRKRRTPEQVLALDDQMLSNFADVCARHLGVDHRSEAGAGAAGGLGFAAKAFLQAHFRPGVKSWRNWTRLAGKPSKVPRWCSPARPMVFLNLARKNPGQVAKIAQQAGDRSLAGGVAG